jgi:hypothetical protein
MSEATVTCICGQEMEPISFNLLATYAGKSIKVLNVPAYTCDSRHLKTSVSVRKRVRSLLKGAYTENLQNINFKEEY